MFDPHELGRPGAPIPPEDRPSLTTVRGYSRQDRLELLAAAVSLFVAAFVLITLYLVALS